MAKNSYAVKLMAAKATVTREERKRIIDRTITTVYLAAVVVLNEGFGFGRNRIEKFKDLLDATVQEYGALIDGADVDYADDKLLQRYRQIMGEPDE